MKIAKFSRNIVRYGLSGLLLLSGASSQQLLISCADNYFEGFNREPLYLRASAEEPASSSRLTTRAGLNVQGSSFDAGESIVAYISDVEGTKVEDGNGNAHWPAFFTTSSADENTHLNVLTHSPQLYYPLGGKNINIKAYYPSTVTSSDDKFTVSYNQSDERDYKNSDLMYAEKLGQARTAESVNLMFSHKLVKFIFNVEGDGSSVSVGAPYLTQVNRAIGFNPETGALTELSDGSEDKGDVLLDNGGAIIIPPQTISGNFIGIAMTSTRDNETRSGTATFSLQTPKTLQSGKVYTVNIVLGHDNLPEEGQSYTYPITKWDDDAGVISIAPAGTTGISVATPPDAVYTGSEIKPEPEVKFGKNRVLTKNTDYEYQYFNNVHGGKAIVLVVGKGDYSGFSVATSFTITPATATLSYASDAENWREGQEQGKVKMKYSYNGKVDNPLTTNTNGEVAITYNSTNASVATVNASTGEVTVKGTGTTTITADNAATADWTAAHAQYELTVEGRSPEDGGSSISVELDYQGKTYVYDGTTRWEPGVTVKDKYTEDGVEKEVVVSSDYYDVSYTDPVNASESAELVITFKEGAPYTGTIRKTYAIAKAESNLQISTTDMYIALPTNTNVTEPNRSRTLSRSFGTVGYSQPSGSNSIATVVVTDNNVTITGVSEGDFELTLNVPEADNWKASTQKIHVYVVQSVFDYAYTGYSQRWVCPAKGTYQLEVWGAQGGSASGVKNGETITSQGGYGAKVQANISLNKGDILYVNVGEHGGFKPAGYNEYGSAYPTTTQKAFNADVRYILHAWNGGGGTVWGLTCASNTDYWVTTSPVCSGGGATDISLGWKDYNTTSVSSNTNWYTPEHLLTRIIVAGGGGGALYYSGEGGTANGTGGGAWEASTMSTTTTMTDPGEGGKLNRGGQGGIYYTGSARDQYTSRTAPIDGRKSGWSGADGVFGDGGFWYCPSEGGGAGGGGWYGGGACGQSSANGSGAGGSSYAWISNLASYYPTAASLTTEAGSTYYKMYSGSTVQNPSQRGYPYLTNASATATANGTDEQDSSLDGKATITCVSISE